MSWVLCWANRAYKGRDHLVQQDNGQGGNYGYREGPWKLLRHDSKKTSNTELRLQRRPIEAYSLYDLSTDPGERNNVIDKHPDVAAQMKDKLAKIIEAGQSRP